MIEFSRLFCIDPDEGLGGMWQGIGTDCDVCPRACCLPEGECSLRLPEACIMLGGVPHPAGTTCDVCPGACCLPDDTCTIVDDPAACEALSGAWQGGGVTCAEATCSGICCELLGDCTLTSGEECVAGGGFFAGDFATCDACLEYGACCTLFTGCSLENEFTCTAILGGTWLGGGTSCDDVNCSEAACCLPDGTCTILGGLGLFECLMLGGEFLGLGSACTDCCPADFDGNGVVGFSDLVRLLTDWGPCSACPTDLNGNGSVGTADLTALLATWGPC